MEKLYRKSELTFFFVWLGIYLLAQNVGYFLSGKIGIPWSATAALNLSMSLFLGIWIHRRGLCRYYGLCKAQVSGKHMLWFVPLLIVSTGNLWNGTAENMPPLEMLCFLVCMASVGFLEEILVRGFLFQALHKSSVRLAVVVSTVSFSAGHILNLFSMGGMSLTDNLFQIAGALCIGFLYAVILLRSKSLWPCILSHCAINMLSAFAIREGLSVGRRFLVSGAEMAIALAYAIFLIKKIPNADT